MGPRLNIRRVFGTALGIYGHNWTIVLPVAIVLSLIPAAIEVFLDHELPHWAASLLTSFIDTFATVIFAGAAEELVHRWEDGERRIRLRGLLARVPPVILPLFFVGLIQAVTSAIGLLLLVIPGFVVWTYLAVAGPAVVAERSGIRGSLRRSIGLVHGNAWRVFWIVVALEVLAALIGFGIGLLLSLVGAKPDAPISLAIGEAFTLPLEGLAIPVLYWRLRELERA